VFQLGFLDAAQLKELADLVVATGIEASKSARRFIDMPEDGLVIRANGQTRCWYDTPPGVEVTPGLADIAQAALRLQIKTPTRLTLQPDQWLPWSHYWEKACGS
jgi:hypothetical protein